MRAGSWAFSSGCRICQRRCAAPGPARRSVPRSVRFCPWKAASQLCGGQPLITPVSVIRNLPEPRAPATPPGVGRQGPFLLILPMLHSSGVWELSPPGGGFQAALMPAPALCGAWPGGAAVGTCRVQQCGLFWARPVVCRARSWRCTRDVNAALGQGGR